MKLNTDEIEKLAILHTVGRATPDMLKLIDDTMETNLFNFFVEFHCIGTSYKNRLTGETMKPQLDLI